MDTKISNEIVVTNPTAELLQWCKDNLVYKNPDYYKKMRMGLYLGRTPKTLNNYVMNGSKLVLPFGTLKRVWTFIKGNPYKVDFKAKKIYPVSAIRLYGYQEKAVRALIQAKNGILISKAGSGKTVMLIELIARLGYKALWINNKIELMNQAYDTAQANINNITLGKITEGKVEIGDITFATVQTLSKIDLDKYRDEWAVVITDEVQNVCSSPTKITQYAKVLSHLAARFKYGCTATLHRSDGLEGTILDIIGDVAYEVPEYEIADKIIRAKIKKVNTDYEVSVFARNADGTIGSYATLINDLVSNEMRNEMILKYLEENKFENCLILSDRVEHLKYLQARLGKGVVIDGSMVSKTAKLKRQEIIKNMRAGKENILFATYSLAKEGLDIPILNRLFLTTPKKDLTVVIQSVGRVERTCTGKTTPIVYDFVDEKEPMLKNMFTSRKRIYKKNGNVIE